MIEISHCNMCDIARSKGSSHTERIDPESMVRVVVVVVGEVLGRRRREG